MKCTKRVFVVGLFFVLCSRPGITQQSKRFTVCNKSFDLVVARTPAERATGYMNKPEPKPGEGMVFVFDEESPQSFWMKNVPYNLDIAFFNKKGVIVSSFTMLASSILQKDDALPRYPSKKPALYAIEFRAGTLSEFGKNLISCKFSPLP